MYNEAQVGKNENQGFMSEYGVAKMFIGNDTYGQ